MANLKRSTILLVCLLLLTVGCTGQSTRPAGKHKQSETPKALVGSWKLKQFGDINHATPVLPHTSVTLSFNSSEKRVSGSAGCNRYMGSYSTSCDTLRFSSLGSTKKMCPEPGIHQQEITYLAALQLADRYKFVDGNLLVIYDNGKKGLKFDSSMPINNSGKQK